MFFFQNYILDIKVCKIIFHFTEINNRDEFEKLIFIGASLNRTIDEVCTSISTTVASINISLIEDFKKFLEKHDHSLEYCFRSKSLSGRNYYTFEAKPGILKINNGTVLPSLGQMVVCNQFGISSSTIAIIVLASSVGAVLIGVASWKATIFIKTRVSVYCI